MTSQVRCGTFPELQQNGIGLYFSLHTRGVGFKLPMRSISPWKHHSYLSEILFFWVCDTAHLLIKHTGSRNPVSRRTGEQVTLSQAQALEELQQYEQLLHEQGLDQFPQYAQQRSDCSSFRNGGDLGFFMRGQMQQPFEEASFALQPGQMSSIVSTDSGLHLIYRIA